MSVHPDENMTMLRDQIRSRVDLTSEITDAGLLAVVEDVVHGWRGSRSRSPPKSCGLSGGSILPFADWMCRPLLDDETVTEIMINGHEHIFVERSGKVERLSLSFEEPREAGGSDSRPSLLGLTASSMNRRQSSMPGFPAAPASISRSAVALQGPVVTIRKFPEKPLLLEHLISRLPYGGSGAFFAGTRPSQVQSFY